MSFPFCWIGRVDTPHSIALGPGTTHADSFLRAPHDTNDSCYRTTMNRRASEKPNTHYRASRHHIAWSVPLVYVYGSVMFTPGA